jgi:hypothetical protein
MSKAQNSKPEAPDEILNQDFALRAWNFYQAAGRIGAWNTTSISG